MRPFVAIFGLAVGIASAAPAQVATPDAPAGTPAADVAAAATPPGHHPADHTPDADPYAPLWHCREQVRSFLSVGTHSRSRRLKALEDCVAAAERRARVEVAGP